METQKRERKKKLLADVAPPPAKTGEAVVGFSGYSTSFFLVSMHLFSSVFPQIIWSMLLEYPGIKSSRELKKKTL